MTEAIRVLREQLEYDNIAFLVDEGGRLENSIEKAMNTYSKMCFKNPELLTNKP